jgi:hypothetical protein
MKARIIRYLMASSYGTVTENIVGELPDPSWSLGEDQTEADRPMLATQAAKFAAESVAPIAVQ